MNASSGIPSLTYFYDLLLGWTNKRVLNFVKTSNKPTLCGHSMGWNDQFLNPLQSFNTFNKVLKPIFMNAFKCVKSNYAKSIFIVQHCTWSNFVHNPILYIIQFNITTKWFTREPEVSIFQWCNVHFTPTPHQTSQCILSQIIHNRDEMNSLRISRTTLS